MRVFVTGGTGLVGAPIVRTLVRRGVEVTALVRTDRGAARMRELGATPLLGAVEDPRTWESVGPHEGMVHSAAIVAARQPWQNFFQVNVEGTRLAAATARRHGARLVHISSVAVYGRQAADDPEGSRNEAAPLGALDEHDYYARSKRLAEEMVRAEVAIGLEAVLLRPCVVYGEDDRLLLPRLTAVARHGWLPRVGAGERPMAIVHADSVADAAVRALEAPQAASRIYQVTNDGEITPREFVAAMSDGLGRPIRSVPVPAWTALALARGAETVLRLLGPGLYPGTVAGAVRFWRGGNPYTSARARTELGWAPQVRHRDAIANLVRGYARAGSRA